MSVARFIADERTFYRVPYAVLSRGSTNGSTARPPHATSAVASSMLRAFVGSKHTYGSPRVHADSLDEGWKVSVNAVADSMRCQGLQGRKPKHSRGTTRQDRKAPKFPDLRKWDFTATPTSDQPPRAPHDPHKLQAQTTEVFSPGWSL